MDRKWYQWKLMIMYYTRKPFPTFNVKIYNSKMDIYIYKIQLVFRNLNEQIHDEMEKESKVLRPSSDNKFISSTLQRRILKLNKTRWRRNSQRHALPIEFL